MSEARPFVRPAMPGIFARADQRRDEADEVTNGESAAGCDSGSCGFPGIAGISARYGYTSSLVPTSSHLVPDEPPTTSSLVPPLKEGRGRGVEMGSRDLSQLVPRLGSLS